MGVSIFQGFTTIDSNIAENFLELFLEMQILHKFRHDNFTFRILCRTRVSILRIESTGITFHFCHVTTFLNEFFLDGGVARVMLDYHHGIL